MLQQTQMERGVSFFLRWMERFPNVAAVAKASEEEILSCWEGLGYYSRARFIHQSAKAMMEHFGGAIPCNQKDLATLPGLGEYTVSAILSIAYGQDVVTVDANVERIFSRVFNIEEPVKKAPASAWIRAAAQQILPSGHAREYNQALMELGALVCKKDPRCAECPLLPWCEARKRGMEKALPVLPQRPKMVRVASAHGILIWEKQVLLLKRPSKGPWSGMWEFPGAMLETGENPRAAVIHALNELGIEADVLADLGRIQHNYTHHRLTAHFFRMGLPSRPAECPIAEPGNRMRFKFVHLSDIGTLAMPAHHRKIANQYFFGKRRAYAEQLPL